jgi:TPR repeat protein
MSTGQYGWIAVIVLVLIGAGVLAKNLIYLFRLRKVALTGHCWAQMALGCAYRNRGLRKKAFKWWRIAAENGEPNAQMQLGTAYAYGWGVEQNTQEAIKWCRRSAEQGFAIGQSMLSVIYSNGFGMEEDIIQAYAWSSLAAAQNHPLSADFVQQLEEEMTEPQLEEAKRIVTEYSGKFLRQGFNRIDVREP